MSSFLVQSFTSLIADAATPTPTPTPTPPLLGSSMAPVPSALPSSLSPELLLWVTVVSLLVVAIFVLGNNAITWAINSKAKQPLAWPSVIRAWIAIALIVALIVITTATLGGSDDTLRSTLVGGLVAAVGSATAYYFASKSADTAISAVTSAAAQTVTNDMVPNLVGMTVEAALAQLGSTNFNLAIDASTVAAASLPATVAGQKQPAGTSIPGNSEILVQLVQQVAPVPAAPAAEAQ